MPETQTPGGEARIAHGGEVRPSRPLHIVLLDYRDLHHPEAGGAEVYINELFQRLACTHRVTLLSARYRGAPAEDRIGRIRVLRSGNTATANFMVARTALALARREPVDIFVENICKLPFLLPAFTQIPVLPIVLHLFGHTIFYELNPLVAAYSWLYERLIPPVYRGLHFVALSESTAHDLERRGLRHAGIDIVVRAFARVLTTLPAARLVIVGKGDDQGRLEDIVRSLGIGAAVQFAGFVSEAEKIAWLQRAHVVLYPSPKEGWGLSTIEAAACGTPVLASDAEGLRDAVRHGVTGFLIPHTDVEAWAQRMLEVLSNAALRQQLGAGGREWARGFDWAVEAEKMRRIVEQVAARAPQQEHR